MNSLQPKESTEEQRIPSHLLQGDRKTTTPSMQKSLEQLYGCLLCPLCKNVLVQPSTLTCAHTFCRECIRSYSCNSWTCPVAGCGMPVSILGGRDGSFLRINPSLETVVTSFQTICKTLDQAPTEWWKMDEDVTTTKEGTDDDEEILDFNVRSDDDDDQDSSSS